MARGGQRELILEQRHLLGVFFGVVLLAANTWYSLVYLRDDDLRDGDAEPGDDRSNDPPVDPCNDEGER